VKNSGVVGHLVYQDHSATTPVRIQATQIDTVTPGICSTTITGRGQSDEGTVDFFQVDVTDSASGDMFGIHATGAVPDQGDYIVPATLLGGGNIKIHDQSCS
jgi:hypothetical protein